LAGEPIAPEPTALRDLEAAVARERERADSERRRAEAAEARALRAEETAQTLAETLRIMAQRAPSALEEGRSEVGEKKRSWWDWFWGR
jgi:predicted GTPase